MITVHIIHPSVYDVYFRQMNVSKITNKRKKEKKCYKSVNFSKLLFGGTYSVIVIFAFT